MDLLNLAKCSSTGRRPACSHVVFAVHDQLTTMRISTWEKIHLRNAKSVPPGHREVTQATSEPRFSAWSGPLCLRAGAVMPPCKACAVKYGPQAGLCRAHAWAVLLRRPCGQIPFTRSSLLLVRLSAVYSSLVRVMQAVCMPLYDLKRLPLDVSGCTKVSSSFFRAVSPSALLQTTLEAIKGARCVRYLHGWT